MIDENELRKLYLDERMTQRALATHFECSQTTVRHYLAKYGIRRSRVRKYTRGDGAYLPKPCTNCKQVKEPEGFYARDKGRRLSSWCRRCLIDATLERQRALKRTAVEYKGGECQCCGFNTYVGALEFHHLNPAEKDFEVSKWPRKTMCDVIKAELDKCVLLCSNCHRMVHAGVLEPPTNV